MLAECAKRVTMLISELTQDFVIAGGYPRDLLINSVLPPHIEKLEPKDVDFHMFNVTNPCIIESLVTRFEGLGYQLDEYACGKSECTEFQHVLKFKGIPVDIIFYYEDIQTIDHVLATFDFNINQCIMHYTANGGTEVLHPPLDHLILTHPLTDAARTTKARERFELWDRWSK